MKKLVLISLFLTAVVMTSCRKDHFEPNAPRTMEELKVPANFNWGTTKDYTITFTTNVAGLVEVSNSAGVSYQKAFLAQSTPYAMKLSLPAYEKMVKLRFQGKTIDLPLGAPALSYQFN